MHHRSDPIIEELKAMKQRMDVLFHETLTEESGHVEPTAVEEPAWEPHMECWEGPDLWVLYADLPGVQDKEISIEVGEGMLKISGARSISGHPARSVIHASERPRGAFRRSFPIPRDARCEGIEAELKGGVLTIRIQKKPGAPEVSRRIPVHSA